ncbi:hypothetical protein Pan14r_43070 [Crateriforma conspicua]|uniref:Uncharacterized protein n=2 Tax=Crateriforma conspicua TaxID=2527996 RepID=A0A5C5Y9F4_9PLAN|nr:hypothetical protein Pan14r_43070 [Crateriforma conspicua]
MGILASMFAQESSSAFNTSIVLWAVGVAIAVGLLAASANRRQTSLVEILRDFVKRNLHDDDQTTDETKE